VLDVGRDPERDLRVSRPPDDRPVDDGQVIVGAQPGDEFGKDALQIVLAWLADDGDALHAGTV